MQVQPGWDSDAARVLAVVGGLLDVADVTDGSPPQPLQAPAAALARRDEVLRGVRAVARDAVFGLVGRGPRSLAVAAAGLRDALYAVHEVGPGGPSWGHDTLGALGEVEERWALAANAVSAFEAYRSLPAGELSTDRLREMLAVAGALGEALPHLDRDLAARAPELMSPAASNAGAVGLLADPARNGNLGWAASRVRLAVERTAGLPPAPLLAPGRPPLAPSASGSTAEATMSLAGALGQHPRGLHMAELHEIGRALQTGCLTAAVVLGRVDGSLTGAGSLRERAQQAAAALNPLVNLRARSLGVPRTAVLETARMLERVLGDTARQEVGVGSAAALRAVRPVLAWLTVAPQLADAAAGGPWPLSTTAGSPWSAAGCDHPRSGTGCSGERRPANCWPPASDRPPPRFGQPDARRCWCTSSPRRAQPEARRPPAPQACRCSSCRPHSHAAAPSTPPQPNPPPQARLAGHRAADAHSARKWWRAAGTLWIPTSEMQLTAPASASLNSNPKQRDRLSPPRPHASPNPTPPSQPCRRSSRLRPHMCRSRPGTRRSAARSSYPPPSAGRGGAAQPALLNR